MSTPMIYPIFFILERVDNGFILSYKTPNSTEIKKEVVLEERINLRIGELLAPCSLKPGHTSRYFVDNMSMIQNTTSSDSSNYDISDELFKAKLSLYNFESSKLKEGVVLGIINTDENSIDILGKTAVEFAKANSLTIAKKYGVPLISFANSKEGRMSLSKCATQIKLIEFSKQELLDWYHSPKQLDRTSNP